MNYHFVFCPRYKREIFLQIHVENRFKKLVQEICDELKLVIVALECDNDHAHMFSSYYQHVVLLIIWRKSKK